MMDWQPISTAPKDGTPVLLFTPGKGRWIAKWKKSKSVWRVVHPGSVKKQKEGPTHWMPLPDPPAKDSTVMTDEELIEFYCKPEIPIGEKNPRFARLIALATIGARVKTSMQIEMRQGQGETASTVSYFPVGVFPLSAIPPQAIGEK